MTSTLNVTFIPPESFAPPVLAARGKILAFESMLAASPGAQFGDNEDCPLKHTFCDGIYVREIRIPAGKPLTGKIHRHSHPNFLVSGRAQVFTEGGGVELLEGPAWMISKAGTKRVVLALTDLHWITVHRVDSTDLAEVEAEVIAPSYEELERKALCPG